MEKIDFWKKHPSFLIGQALPTGFIPNEFLLDFSQFKRTTKEILSQSLLLIHDNLENSKKIIEQIHSMGLFQGQIILLHNESQKKSSQFESAYCTMFYSKEDSADEIRARLLQTIEINNSRILSLAISDFSLVLDPATHQRALDRARLAHAICVYLQLMPSQHFSCLQNALRFEKTYKEELWNKNVLKDPWSTNFSLEKILLDICELALRNPQSINFRQSYRSASSQLPFKLRSDLKNAMENCFQHIWGENLNVA